MSMHEGTETGSKVVSLFNRSAKSAESSPAAEGEESFEDVMRRNDEVKERLRRERLKANQAVLRSYKIKN